MARLVLAETIKLSSQRFLYVAIPFLILGTLAGAYWWPIFTGRAESAWGKFNSYQLIAYGTMVGGLFASFMLTGFTSLLFAGEFDRGTIKNLLTRPVTRTDVFASKVIVALLLSLGFYLLVLYTSGLYGVLRGDLGPVWDGKIYEMKRTAEQMERYLWTSVWIGFLPIVTASFLGLLVSNLTETSWAAVMISLIVCFVILVLILFGPERIQERLFTFYSVDPFNLLRKYAEGEGILGYEPGHETSWFREKKFLKVPLAYLGASLVAAYVAFRTKNIHA